MVTHNDEIKVSTDIVRCQFPGCCRQGTPQDYATDAKTGQVLVNPKRDNAPIPLLWGTRGPVRKIVCYFHQPDVYKAVRAAGKEVQTAPYGMLLFEDALRARYEEEREYVIAALCGEHELEEQVPSVEDNTVRCQIHGPRCARKGTAEDIVKDYRTGEPLLHRDTQETIPLIRATRGTKRVYVCWPCQPVLFAEVEKRTGKSGTIKTAPWSLLLKEEERRAQENAFFADLFGVGDESAEDEIKDKEVTTVAAGN